MSFLLNPFVFAGADGDFESIATVTVGSGGATNIQFTSIPSTYQHLQIRGVWRNSSAAASEEWLGIQLNGDTTGSNYAYHSLYGTGSSATAEASTTVTRIALGPRDGRTANVFGAVIADVLDYGSASKNTVVRTFWGYDANGSGVVGINSTLWKNTNAVTSVNLVANSNDHLEHTTFALYGIRA